MAHGRARDERKGRLWRRWIDQWRISGLSVRAFCARYCLTTASFYNWRRVLERRAAEHVVFAPVQVVPDALSVQRGGLEVVLTDGRVVRVAVHVRKDNQEGTPPLVQLKALCGPGDRGEPVITVMLPDED